MKICILKKTGALDSMEVIIKDTYFNNKFNYEQEEKAFKLSSVLTINKDDAIFKVNGVVNEENIDFEHHFDWDEEIESLLKQAIVKKTSLEKMDEFKLMVDSLLARNLMDQVWSKCDQEFTTMYKEMEAWPKDSITRETKLKVSLTASAVMDFIEKINSALPEDEQRSLAD